MNIDRRQLRVIVAIALFLVAAGVLWYTGIGRFFSSIAALTVNTAANTVVAGSPDTSCTVDADCVVKQIECTACLYGSEAAAVNKEWSPYCPLDRRRACLQALPSWYHVSAECVEGVCKAVPPNRSDESLPELLNQE